MKDPDVPACGFPLWKPSVPTRRSTKSGPLLALRQSTAADDTHLIHVGGCMVLWDQFQSSEAWSKLDTLNLSERDLRDIADAPHQRAHSPGC